MGKCYFDSSWLEKPIYKDWLRVDATTKNNFYCSVCNQSYIIGQSGIKALDVHMKTNKHRAAKSSKSMFNYMSNAITGTNKSQQLSVVTSQTQQPSQPTRSSQLSLSSNDTLSAEIRWVMHILSTHGSARSSDSIGQLFKTMFPDSGIAKQFSCSRTKLGYLATFGIAPCIRDNIVKAIKSTSEYVLLFDESMNADLQSKQLDVHVRFMDCGKVKTRYIDSYFLGHAKASDIQEKLMPLIEKLGPDRILQLSMDGPHVNWKVFREVSDTVQERSGHSLLNIGSCGLHVVHNSFKSGIKASGWDLENFLKSLFYLFQDSPARREDFMKITNCSALPLKFCGHRWLENIPAAERAIAIWPAILEYIISAKNGKIVEPTCKSFKTVSAYEKDILILAKLQCFVFIAKILRPFLTKFQKDEPLSPFLAKDLFQMVKRMYSLILDPDYMVTLTKPAKVQSPKDIDKKHYLHHKKIQIGHQAETAVEKEKKKASELQIMEMRIGFQAAVKGCISKILDKSPLKYKFCQDISCLDPENMRSDSAPAAFKSAVKHLNTQGWIADSEVDECIFQFNTLRDRLGHIPFLATDRLDIFLGEHLEDLPELKKVVNVILILSHGNAEVERGFSVNKEVTVENLHEESLVARRLICQYVSEENGAESVKISEEMIRSGSKAWHKYKEALEEKIKLAKEAEGNNKRKRKHEEVKELISKKRRMELDIDTLQRSADKYCEEAECAGSSKKTHELIVKANALRRDACEKKKQVATLSSDISQKEQELQSLC